MSNLGIDALIGVQESEQKLDNFVKKFEYFLQHVWLYNLHGQVSFVGNRFIYSSFSIVIDEVS